MRLLLPLGAALLVAFAACSGSENHDDAPAADAGPDARPVVDAGRDVAQTTPGPLHPTARCENPKPPGATFEVADGGAPAEAGAPVDADGGEGGVLVTGPVRRLSVPSSGGPVLTNPRWVPVFYKDTDDQVDLTDFLGSIGCTDYWHTITADYGVGEGISGPATVVDEEAPARLTDTQIEKWLVKQITAGTVEKPTPNTLYVIFYPTGTTISQDTGTSCLQFGGYHYQVNVAGTPAAYAVIPRCGDFDQLTATVTHELIEASTDPFPANDPAFSSPDSNDLAWAFAAGGEVGDLCTFIDDSTFTPDGYPYAVQRSFSNKASLAGHDPCVPSTRPYFYAAPALESSIYCADCGGITTTGVNVPAGTSKTVDVTLGADNASVGALQVAVLSGKQLHLQVASGASGSSFTLDKDSGQPGDHLRLTISATSSAGESEIFALVASYLGRRHYWYGLVTH